MEVFSRVEELSEIGLGLPPATDFMYRLKQAGAPVETTALTVQEALADVVTWKRGEQK